MRRIVTQIYEIQNPQEAEAMVELGVDRIGSVVLSLTDWKVPSIREVSRLVRGTGARHSLIPLFSEPNTVFRVLEYYQPDILHFCDCMVSDNGGFDDPGRFVEFQYSIRQRFPRLELMRSIPIPMPGRQQRLPTLEIARALQEASDCFLTDTWLGAEPVQGFIGITGKTCDWETARLLVERSTIPVFLAGGMSVSNVYEGILAVKPFGVDSCTNTNATDGQGRSIRFKKDIVCVERFLKEVRRAEQELWDVNQVNTRNAL
jgi:phosphoribosylanthranilate isomerase